MKIKNIVLDNNQRNEILKLIEILKEHKNKYKDFKNFVKTDLQALEVASALLNNDYATFKKHQLKYTTHTADKMRGMMSLSTYKYVNQYCNYLRLCGDSPSKKSICARCYADKSIKLYNSTLTPTLIYNTLLLKYIDLCADNIPYINNKYFRFESFADIQNAQHLYNLIQVCKKNKSVLFTLWTKTATAFKSMMQEKNIKRLPSNLNIIVSSVYINDPFKIDYLNTLQYSINSNNKIKCFTVYDDESKQKTADGFLCKNKCIDCLKCYKKTKNIIYINEKLH